MCHLPCKLDNTLGKALAILNTARRHHVSLQLLCVYVGRGERGKVCVLSVTVVITRLDQSLIGEIRGLHSTCQEKIQSNTHRQT